MREMSSISPGTVRQGVTWSVVALLLATTGVELTESEPLRYNVVPVCTGKRSLFDWANT